MQTTETPSQPVNDQPRRKILLVEDDAAMADFVTTLLGREPSYEVIRMPNGMEAYRYLSHETVDLILTDILMPEMDGIELIQKRGELAAADTPIIAFSGGGYRMNQTDLLKFAKTFGARMVMQKPVNPQALLAAIASIVEN